MKDNQAKTRPAKGVARQHLLAVADDLFYNRGIRAVGVDTIVAESGVAKTTLYDHFKTKDDLIVAYLEGRDQHFWAEVEASLAQHPGQAKQQFVDLFDGLESLLLRPEFQGCPFLSASAEFPELDQPGHQVSLTHKKKMRARFQDLVTAVGVKNPDQLADQLVLLVDGAFASKRVYRSDQSPALQLKSAALMLLEGHLNQRQNPV